MSIHAAYEMPPTPVWKMQIAEALFSELISKQREKFVASKGNNVKCTGKF